MNPFFFKTQLMFWMKYYNKPNDWHLQKLPDKDYLFVKKC